MEDPIITKIRNKFDKEGNPAKIPLMKGNKSFVARSEEEGIYVDNLGNQPFLPWRIFSEAINCLKENGGKAKKGNAVGSRLGDLNLDLTTMEGYIANKVYGCKIGDTVFRRITPIASILSWAEICENTRGQICLLPEGRSQIFKDKEEVSLDKDIELKNYESELAQKEEAIEDFKNKLHLTEETVESFKRQIVLMDKSIQELEDRVEDTNTLEGRLLTKEKEMEKLEESISTKDRDLQTLAEKVMEADSEIRKIEEKLAGKEKKISTLEITLAASEEKVKKLEKQLSGYIGEEKLALQLKEKEELIKQLKGTLASKEEEFSRLNEENRKYRMHQKFASDGLKQIDEQKASKKWWRRL